MRTFAATTLISIVVLILAGCSTGALIPARTDAQSVTFNVNPYVRMNSQLVLVTANGAVVAAGASNGRSIRFRLPTGQQWVPYSGQCLQVRARTGQQISISGVDDIGFMLPLWQASMRSQYEGGYLQQQRTRLVQQINYDRQNYQNASIWMRNNPGIYANGTCQTPSLPAQPGDACENPVVAHDIAAGKCESQSLCAGLGAAAGYKAGDLRELAEFAVENGCVARMLKARGESYTPENLGEGIGAAIGLAVAASALEQLGMSKDDAYVLSRGVFVVWEYNSCMSRETSTCSAKYQSWLNGPQNAHETCVAAVGILQNNPQKISQEQSTLLGIDNQMAALRTQTSNGGGGAVGILSCGNQ